MAYLVLSSGDVFEGQRFGARISRAGELVFTTGMVGYVETLTDPSYAGQIVVQTFPLIGNYGVCPDDFEGKPALLGYVTREISTWPSNFRSQGSVEQMLIEHRIPGICGMDTRQITRILREQGVMTAAICDEVDEGQELISRFDMGDVVSQVTCAGPRVLPAMGERRFRVTLIDYGAKGNIARSLQQRGCEVTVVPSSTPAEKILADAPDGIMLSNGPGDPKVNVFCIEQIRRLMGQLPIFGICLGHQLTALAMGGETVKLKYGHRGGNQPVRLTGSHRTFITSQNHGYAVVSESLEQVGRELYVNANDGSCEGMLYPDARCFTVQFHPEACSGPKDTGFLFDRFISMMGGESVAKGFDHP